MAGSRNHTSGPLTGAQDRREESPHAETGLVRTFAQSLRGTTHGKTGKHEEDRTINRWCSGLEDDRKAGDLTEPP